MGEEVTRASIKLLGNVLTYQSSGDRVIWSDHNIAREGEEQPVKSEYLLPSIKYPKPSLIIIWQSW